MTLTLELTPQEEQALRLLAGQEGLELAQYAKRCLPLPVTAVSSALSEDDWEALEAALAEGIDPALAPLSDEAVSRANIYGECGL